MCSRGGVSMLRLRLPWYEVLSGMGCGPERVRLLTAIAAASLMLTSSAEELFGRSGVLGGSGGGETV